VDRLTDWVVSWMETLGGPGAGLAIALENLIPIIPSELILPLAGFTASRGGFSLVEALAWTTAGSTIGAMVLYLLGRLLGRDRMRAIAARVPLMRVKDMDATEEWFDRHGRKAVFFGRMLPLFRSLISIPAGLDKMPVLTFALLTTGGSLVWNTIFVLAGFFLGENWQVVEQYASVLQWVVLAAVVAAIAGWVVKRTRSRSRTASGDAS